MPAILVPKNKTAPPEAWRDVNDYMQTCNELAKQDIVALFHFQRKMHYTLFGENLDHNTPLVLVHSRIMLKLQHDGFEETGVVNLLSAKFMQDYRAAMTLGTTLQGFHPDTFNTMKLVYEAETEEEHELFYGHEESQVSEIMSQKREANRNARKLLIKLLLENNIKQFCDEELQKLIFQSEPMASKFRDLSQISRWRGKLNRGSVKDVEQPEEKIKQYRKVVHDWYPQFVEEKLQPSLEEAMAEVARLKDRLESESEESDNSEGDEDEA